jgi:hypothetical protein
MNFISRLMTLLKRISLVASILLVAQLAPAQETIPASGGEVSGSGGSGSYTVGQVFYSTSTSITGSVSQGVQQAFEFQTLSNPALTSVNLTAVTYPNPTKDFIILKITDKEINNLRYTLFDVNGKSIESDVIATSSTQIQMKHLAIGAYVLKVSQKNQSLKTFKIIKNH